ncbi:Glycoside hydrolase family 105 protein [Pyrenophora tritici-repentis]|nr:Glycoside hydrolase family 105 protein [Pyrenophora tritici-repentis]
MHLPTLSLVLAGTAFAAKNTTRPYSTWMAHSFRSKNQTIDNHYVSAVIHEGYAKAAMAQNDTELAAFAAGEVSSIVSANGTLKGWNSTFYTLDDIRIGNNLLHVWNSEGRKDNKYVIAAKGLREQLNRWPRTPEGGFWHRAPTYENQMWLDGLYMADTFYATYTSYFEPENTTAWNEIELQFDQIEEHCRNKTSNLLKHGFSSDKSTVWADPITGASPYVWDRALGWYFVALVEVLEVWPKTHAGYSKLLNYYTTLASGIKDVQDISGGWWLLMDEQLAGLTGNYIESSATALFTYSYLKGVRLGLLEQAYQDTAVKAWDLLLDEFIQYEQNGTLSFTGTVTVGSLKGDASYEYYTTVPLLVNDGKVIRGRAAGNRRIPRSKVQRVAQLLPATPRNVLASPHFSDGSRQDPTQGQGKDIAAQNFTIWWESLGQETITVFSDGSEQQINGTRVVTYGYAIYQGQAAVATGQGSLNALSHVFDAEAIGACRGLKHALQLSLPSQREIVLCIDSTSVIWGIRGTAPTSSQWAFLQIHGAMEAYNVKTRWAPGHMKIVGNELADQLADSEAKDPHQPYSMAASPTRSGIRTVGRRLLEHTRDTWWKDKSSRLSA